MAKPQRYSHGFEETESRVCPVRNAPYRSRHSKIPDPRTMALMEDFRLVKVPDTYRCSQCNEALIPEPRDPSFTKRVANLFGVPVS